MKEHDAPKPLKAVYCYLYPDVRPIVGQVDALPRQEQLALTQTSIQEARDILASLFKNPLDIPQTPEGNISLDEIHKPILDRILKVYEPIVPGISSFKEQYPTAGSSEGLFHVLSNLRTKGITKIYALRGEYEGYKEYGKTLGIETQEIDPYTENIKELPLGEWFISNPCAKDGNILPDTLLSVIANYGHSVHLDLAYVGITPPHLFDVTHPNIKTVFLSWSKPYGIFRWRAGFTLSKEPINSLYANKWFKNVPSLLLALKLAEDIGPTYMHHRHAQDQKEAVATIQNMYDLPIQASDALLLAHLPDHQVQARDNSDIETYKRGPIYRFCLTPIYEWKEKQSEAGS